MSILAALCLLLQEPWDKAPFEGDPAEMITAAKAVVSEPGTAVVLLLREARWVFQTDGKGECRLRTVYRVLNEEGTSGNSAVDAEWSPWFQERPSVRARVISPDGKVHPLNPETLAEQPVASGTPDVFTDRRSLAGPLPRLVPGAIVELETVTRQTRPFFDRGVVSYQQFGGRRTRLILDAPDSMGLRHVVRQLPDLQPRRESAGGRTVLTFEGGPFEKPKGGEYLVPSDVPQSRYVAFTTGTGWSEIARRYHEIVEAQIAKADLAGLGDLPAADLPPGERISRILALVQAKARYTSLALGDASIVPRPPAETLKRGYGDCKDKSALVVAALRKAGIEADVALLATGPGPDIETDLPGLGAFDHAIVHVRAPDLWIDPADKYSRAGSLPLQDQDRWALIARAETTELLRTPAGTSRDNHSRKEREVHLADFGPARIIETMRGTGEPERRLRQLLEQDPKNLEKSMESYVSQVLLSSKVVKSSHGDASDLTKPLELRIEAAECNRGQTDLREAMVGIPVEVLFGELPYFLRGGEIEEKDGEPWRKNDVVLYNPHIVEWTYRIVPPPGFQARPLPKNETVALGPSQLSKEFAKGEDGSVTVVLRFDSGKRRMTPKEARELREGIDRIQQDGMLLVGFAQVGTSHLEAGRIKEALSAFRTLAETHPQKALYRAQIARALLAAGLGDAARLDARKAMELEPTSLVALQTEAWILQHDLIGRRFEKGWDPKGAEEAYRAALKVKPGHLENTLDLAIMLEHDASGQRYTAGSRLKDAIDLYKSVLKQIEGTAFEVNLNHALLWAGRFAELSQRLRNAQTPPARAMLLIARTALDGADSGLAYAARAIPAEEERRSSLAAAGELLAKLRKYPEAAAMLSAAARGAPEAANILGRADRIRKTRRWEDQEKEAKDPVGAIKRHLALMMAPELDVEALQPFLSRYTLDEAVRNDTLESLRRTHAATLGNMRKQGIPLEVVRDFALSQTDPSVEGDDATGYRIRMTALFGSGQQTWYVHLENGRHKILGDHEIGRLAMELLEAGQNDKARIWLDRLADEIPEGADRDPLEAEPFAVIWKKGKEPDAKTMRLAAAMLACDGAGCSGAIKILEEARKDPGAEPKMPYLLDRAIAAGYLREKKYAEAAVVGARMLKAEPDSNTALYTVNMSLEKQKKYDEVQALLEEQLRRKPTSTSILRSFMHLEMVRGRQASCQEFCRRLIKMGQSSPSLYNSLAWSQLLEGKTTDATLQDIQKSVMGSQGRSEHILHTMATVYADLGRPAEARDVLLQCFRSRSTPEPETHDWYVLGRIAEEYGAREAAVAAYRRTAADENATLLDNTNQLSLRRLQLLGEK